MTRKPTLINVYDRIQHHFEESIHIHNQSLHEIPNDMAQASEMMTQSLLSGHKILCCGNGGSAADAQHFAAEMLNRFEMERPSLPAIALTTDTSTLTSIANDYDFTQVFSRQIKALGLTGDLLLAISTSGNSENVLEAIDAAHSRHIHTILLTGANGGQLAKALNSDDLMICVPATRTCRIQELHIFILHCLCDIIDHQLFANEDVTS